jgi:hypothetical protein
MGFGRFQERGGRQEPIDPRDAYMMALVASITERQRYDAPLKTLHATPDAVQINSKTREEKWRLPS